MPLRADAQRGRRRAWTSRQHGEEAYADGEGAILVLPERDAKVGATAMAAAEGGRA